jgi:hypothetical protein
MLGAHIVVISALGIFPRFYQGTTNSGGEVVTGQDSLLVADLRFARRPVIARRERVLPQ